MFSAVESWFVLLSQSLSVEAVYKHLVFIEVFLVALFK